MALVRFGGGVAELRGSIAGNVFSRSRAGAIVRNRAVPINPQTQAQTDQRARMQSAVDNFRELSKEAVGEWAEFASTQERVNRLGETYVPSGKQVFTEIALNFQLLASPPSPNLPEAVGNPNLPNLEPFGLAITNTGGVMTNFDLTDVASFVATRLIVQATPPIPDTIRNMVRYFRWLPPVQTLAGTVDITAEYLLAYPTPGNNLVVGTQIGIRARALNLTTGLAGAWIYNSITVPDPV